MWKEISPPAIDLALCCAEVQAEIQAHGGPAGCRVAKKPDGEDLFYGRVPVALTQRRRVTLDCERFAAAPLPYNMTTCNYCRLPIDSDNATVCDFCAAEIRVVIATAAAKLHQRNEWEKRTQEAHEQHKGLSAPA